MAQNEHVYAMCYRPDVDADVISGRNVRTIKGYVLKLLALAVSEIFHKDHFVTVKSATVSAICSRLEVVDDLSYGYDAEILKKYVCVNLG